MNEEVESLRKRLKDLHEKRLTGFVNDEQFAQSRALLERKLVDAVMRIQGDDEDEWPATVLMGDMRGEAVPMAPLPAFAMPAPPSRMPWVLGVSGVAMTVATLVYWWASSR